MLSDGEIEATRPLNFVNRPPDTLDTFSCFMGGISFYVEYEKQLFTQTIQKLIFNNTECLGISEPLFF
jgi:hypothetical protein